MHRLNYHRRIEAGIPGFIGLLFMKEIGFNISKAHLISSLMNLDGLLERAGGPISGLERMKRFLCERHCFGPE